MRCPTCGHDNSNLATRCAVCGAILPPSSEVAPEQMPAPEAEALVNSDSEPDTLTLSNDSDTIERQPVPLDDEVPVQPAFQSHLLRKNGTEEPTKPASRGARIAQFFSKHQRAFGIGLASCVVAVLAGVWLVFNLVNVPSYSQIEQDLAARLPVFDYVGGTYGPDLQIPLSSVSVTRREASRTPEGMEVAEGVGPAAFGVEAELTYDDGHIRVLRVMGATYARDGQGWTITSELSELGTTFMARAGVDEAKVIANMPEVLALANTGTGASLANIYEGGTFAIVGNQFTEDPEKDTATNVVVVQCAKDTGFYAYSGNVTATFAFESGEWRLRTAEADASAANPTFSSMVGTWTGTAVDHEAFGGRCYGAQSQPLTVTIVALGDESAERTTVQGTISGLAHCHERLQRDAMSTDGDTVVEGVPFTGTLTSSRLNGTPGDLTLSAAVTSELSADVSFVMQFGTDDDPSSVVCEVTSSYAYEETLLMLFPHQTTAEFSDTYLLMRAG